MSPSKSLTLGFRWGKHYGTVGTVVQPPEGKTHACPSMSTMKLMRSDFHVTEVRSWEHSTSKDISVQLGRQNPCHAALYCHLMIFMYQWQAANQSLSDLELRGFL